MPSGLECKPPLAESTSDRVQPLRYSVETPNCKQLLYEGGHETLRYGNRSKLPGSSMPVASQVHTLGSAPVPSKMLSQTEAKEDVGATHPNLIGLHPEHIVLSSKNEARRP